MGLDGDTYFIRLRGELATDSCLRLRSDGRLRMTRGNGYVADLFHLTALDHSLPFADSR